MTEDLPGLLRLATRKMAADRNWLMVSIGVTQLLDSTLSANHVTISGQQPKLLSPFAS